MLFQYSVYLLAQQDAGAGELASPACLVAGGRSLPADSTSLLPGACPVLRLPPGEGDGANTARGLAGSQVDLCLFEVLRMKFRAALH